MPLLYVYFSFRGRIARSTLWFYSIPLIALAIVPVIYQATYRVSPWLLVLGLAMASPLLAINTKRWHDRNKPGWWNLVALIPCVGFVWALVECGFMPGTPGPNQYGDNPLKNQDLTTGESVPLLQDESDVRLSWVLASEKWDRSRLQLVGAFGCVAIILAIVIAGAGWFPVGRLRGLWPSVEATHSILSCGLVATALGSLGTVCGFISSATTPGKIAAIAGLTLGVPFAAYIFLLFMVSSIHFHP